MFTKPLPITGRLFCLHNSGFQELKGDNVSLILCVFLKYGRKTKRIGRNEVQDAQSCSVHCPTVTAISPAYTLHFMSLLFGDRVPLLMLGTPTIPTVLSGYTLRYCS
jgi:hypothetical protein